MSEKTSRGSSPYQALFRAIPDLDPDLHIAPHRHDSLARAHQQVHESQEKAKLYRRGKGPQTEKDIRVGDYVTLTDTEVLTFGHKRQYSFLVSVRGRVIGIRKEATDPYASLPPVRYVNVDRERVVPPDVPWREIVPRIRRKHGRPEAWTLDYMDFQPTTVSHQEPEPVKEITELLRRSKGLSQKRSATPEEFESKRQKIAWLTFVSSFCCSSLRPGHTRGTLLKRCWNVKSFSRFEFTTHHRHQN